MEIKLPIKKDKIQILRLKTLHIADINNDDDTTAGQIAVCGLQLEITIGEETYTIEFTDIWNAACEATYNSNLKL